MIHHDQSSDAVADLTTLAVVLAGAAGCGANVACLYDDSFLAPSHRRMGMAI